LTFKINEERQAKKQQPLQNRQVSFWYIARSLGETFLGEARSRSQLTIEARGLYSGRCWGHPLFLVSACDAPVEEDTVPLWLVEGDPAPRALGELVVQRIDLLRQYATWILRLQPALWEEVRNMAKTGDPINWEAVAKVLDVDKVIPFLPTD